MLMPRFEFSLSLFFNMLSKKLNKQFGLALQGKVVAWLGNSAVSVSVYVAVSV